ncbi:hypothetical protein P4117_19595 [Pseudomonas aeruginosa]|nr:hypothetical protein [Pseudomonas aeruginosa]EIU4421652.1 hypothetical protein [Pseudomonas aeruginosa]EIU4425342.1 hypothetical protein [Pseudomonas aeruginosa]EKU7806142.1 hypothetical protein [Pseudomonas aeruginosa]EKV0464693.1 hypothetical protein [Pseudomonas aeruginosa]EKV0468611.1 hypothetical protein [Pseudomonas aeruginosa]
MLESEIVAARRAYAASLGVTLSGAISNADEPVHIRHAVSNSNHNPNASNRINLGRARAYKKGARKVITSSSTLESPA